MDGCHRWGRALLSHLGGTSATAPLGGALGLNPGMEARWPPGQKVHSNCSCSDNLLDRLHSEQTLFGPLTEWAQFRRVIFALSRAVLSREILPGCGQEQEVRLGSQPWCSWSIKWEDSVLLSQQAGCFSPPLMSTGTGIDEQATRRKNLGHVNCCWSLYVPKISGCKYADVPWDFGAVCPELELAAGIQKFSSLSFVFQSLREPMARVSTACGNFICVARATTEEQETGASGSAKAFSQI